MCYFALGSLVHIPSVGAFVASLSSLLVVGLSLRIWTAHRLGDPRKLLGAMCMLPLLPLITMVRSGFLGFGAYWILSVISFVFAQTKSRFRYFPLVPIVIYVGLSFFVNYMASRVELRRSVWFEQASISNRLDHVADIFRDFQWFRPGNEKQRELIDGRLNQNLLVAAAMERLDSGFVDYADGSTLVQMALGLIPRAIWPGKPQVGGGGNVVEHYTGIRFAEGTSVGAGQVLEFYINFGTWGVIGGFLIYGVIIGWMDLRIMRCLFAGDDKGVLLWFMMCLALLQPGGNLLEITVSVAGSAITAKMIGFYLDARRRAHAPGLVTGSDRKPKHNLHTHYGSRLLR
jgi:energy-coupling factor transporter transmembrane protein EcfT